MAQAAGERCKLSLEAALASERREAGARFEAEELLARGRAEQAELGRRCHHYPWPHTELCPGPSRLHQAVLRQRVPW